MNANCGFKISDEQAQALSKLQQVDFMLVDLNLYLDMHPECQQAIEDYNALVELKQELKKDSMSRYGALMNFGTSSSTNPWQWVDENAPWPWENERR